MPELPEVETVKNELSPHVIGRLITGVSLEWEGMARPLTAAELTKRLSGRRIKALNRRGKYLLFGLDDGQTLVIHLKMTGSLLLGEQFSVPPQYTRATITLDNGYGVYFCDARKFGRMQITEDIKSIIGGLGPEPLEAGFTAAVLGQLLSRRKTPVKAALLDQKLVAGIGNMYADESLFAAGIHPERPANSLSSKEIKHLHQSIRNVLAQAIEAKGASVSTYYRPGGEKGDAQSAFKVAHRRGQNCPECGQPLERICVRGRGTYFCPVCQPPL